MLFFRVQVNSIARAELVPPLCQVHKVDLIPVLDMVPLVHFPPFHYPQKRTFCDSSTAKAPSPVRSRTENQGALMKAAAKKKERNVSFAKWRSPWLKKAYPWKKETMKLSTFFPRWSKGCSRWRKMWRKWALRQKRNILLILARQQWILLQWTFRNWSSHCVTGCLS